MVFLGVVRDDSYKQAAALARKAAELRTLEGKHSVIKVDAPILIASQFTLYGDTRRGRRPSWSKTTPSEQAESLISALVEDLRAHDLHAGTEVFGATMEVSLVNSRPFTVLAGARGVKTGSGWRPEMNGDGD